MTHYLEIVRFSPRHHSYIGAHYSDLARAMRLAARYQARLAEKYPKTQVALIAFQDFDDLVVFDKRLTPAQWDRQPCVAVFPPPVIPVYVGHQRLPGDRD